MYNDSIFNRIKEVLCSRLFYIWILFSLLSVILISRLYYLQIVKEDGNKTEKEYYTVKERYIPATRGIIYDRNGIALAENALSYNVYLEQFAELKNNAQKNAMLLKLTRILREHNVDSEIEFAIEIDDEEDLRFNLSDNALLRFKKNAYGLKSVNNLTEEQRNATAYEVFDFLCHGDKSSVMFEIPDELTLRERLDICAIRYLYFSDPDNSTRYTVATNVSDVVIAALLEASAELPGVSVEQQTKRVYNYSEYFAHIIGYTGLINESELEELNKNEESGKYISTDYVGKTGIELKYETELAGKKGVELVTLNNAGRIISKEVISDPVPGNNIYLTLDANLHKQYYKLLEENIASVLSANLVNEMDYGTKGTSSDDINIPVYEVYYALFSNRTLDIDSLKSEEATAIEKQVYSKYLDYAEELKKKLLVYTAYGNSSLPEKEDETVRSYISYIYSQMKTLGLVDQNLTDKNDPYYIAYDNNEISFYEYMEHCISEEWVSLAALNLNDSYKTSEEVYNILMDKTFKSLENNRDFDLMVLHDLIFSYKLTGNEICLLLFDQNVLEYNENQYKSLKDQTLSPFSFIKEKIKNTDITPKQLAIEPYSGVVVQTDVDTGKVIAIVNYPSYDNNMLANKIDWSYYSNLLSDASNPLYNRATQMRTPTGSTIKPFVAVAGLMANVFTSSEKIHDDIVFTKIDPAPSCWMKTGHGDQTLSSAIRNSCNYFFYEIGYRLATLGVEKYSDSLGITTLFNAGVLFGLNENTGIEISEAEPGFASEDAVRSSIGYGHKFTPTQLSRYASTLAMRGDVCRLTIIAKITDNKGNVTFISDPSSVNNIKGVSDDDWDAINKGMEEVITYSTSLNKAFSTVPCKVALKTGTAEISDNNAPHAIAISYAPSNNPETSVIAIITNGYSGTNVAILVSDVYKSYYNIIDNTEIGDIIFIGD